MDDHACNEITRRIIGAAIEVHKQVGCGLLESIYGYCMMEELLSLLRLSGKRLGLLINFHVPVLKDGIHRIINSRA